ncbi:MAG: hypothetical protein HQL91_03825 [Magnetococcales bacterium]|nr:hypothetical protein [Magnetococcales bacterium]
MKKIDWTRSLSRPAWLERLSQPADLSWEGLRARLTRKTDDGSAPPAAMPDFSLERLRKLLTKPKVAGMAALFASNNEVGLIHLVPGSDTRPRLNRCVFQTVPKGQKPGRVAQELVRAHKLEKARFVGLLDRNAYQLFPAEAPDLPREEWAAAMKWRIKDQISFPVIQAVLEVFDMPGNKPGAESARIYVAAAKDGEVRRHVQLFLEAGVNLTALDIPELALLNLTRHLEQARDGMALLHLEAKSGLVLMIRAGEFYLARRIEGGIDLLKESLSADGSGVTEAPFMDRIALEAQRTMDYYESHFGLTQVSSLQVMPLPTPLIGFRQALAERLGMRINYLNPDELLELPDGIPEENLARALPAIGAAMRASVDTP